MDLGSSLSCTTLQDLGRVKPYTHKWSSLLLDPRSLGADQLITSVPTKDLGSRAPGVELYAPLNLLD